MEINFLNVNSGDTILISWESNSGKQLYGVIDCALPKKGVNPLLEKFKEKNIKEIEFAICTHPHTDHYKGFFDIFEYCQEYDVVIKNFIHTISFANKNLAERLQYEKMTKKQKRTYILSIAQGEDSGKTLLMFYKILHWQQNENNSKQKFIKRIKSIAQEGNIYSSDNFAIEAFAPNFDNEITEYWSKASQFDKNSQKLFLDNNNPKANLLSTLLVLTFNENKILLTSDIEKAPFRRAFQENSLSKLSYSVLQIPHHGSIDNFDFEIWKKIMKSIDKQIFITSSGDRYEDHPHFDICSFIGKDKGVFGLFCTNFVNGYKNYIVGKSPSELKHKFSFFRDKSGSYSYLNSGIKILFSSDKTMVLQNNQIEIKSTL